MSMVAFDSRIRLVDPTFSYGYLFYMNLFLSIYLLFYIRRLLGQTHTDKTILTQINISIRLLRKPLRSYVFIDIRKDNELSVLH